MKYDPEKHHRRSIRLKGYDYSRPGAYFVTICTYTRECLFGEIVDGKMLLNELGKMTEFTWFDLPNHNPHIRLDEFIIMPNHVHGIIILDDENNVGGGIGGGIGIGGIGNGGKNTVGVNNDTVGAGSVNDEKNNVGNNIVTVGAGSEPAPTVPPPPSSVPPTPTPTPPTTIPTTPSTVQPSPPPTPFPKRHGLPEIVRQFKTFSARRINKMRDMTGCPVWQRNYYEHIIRNANEYYLIKNYIKNNPIKWNRDRNNPNNINGLEEKR